jgi:hypothetical protein
VPSSKPTRRPVGMAWMWTLSRGSNTNARVCRDPRGRHGCIRQKLAAGMKSCPSSKASKRDGHHILTRDNVKRWVSRRADSPHGQSRNFAEQGSNLAPQKAGFIFAAGSAHPSSVSKNSFFSGNSQPAIDLFVMAITSLEAVVRHPASHA